jgi:hypothetical protein
MRAESKKRQLELAKSHYENCAKILKAHESLWQDIWMAQPNPFLRIKEYTSARQKAMRKPIIDAWIEAKKNYEALAKPVRGMSAIQD